MPVVANGGLVGRVISDVHELRRRCDSSPTRPRRSGVTFKSGKTDLVVSGRGREQRTRRDVGAARTRTWGRAPSSTTDGLNGALYPAGLRSRPCQNGDADARGRDLQPHSHSRRRPAPPDVPRRRALGAACVRKALLPVTVVTLLMVAIQLSIFSTLALCRRRGDARVALAARHWPHRVDRARHVERARGGRVL